MKTCSQCGLDRPESEFYATKAGVLFPECKACNIARSLAWNVANPEKFAASKARAHRNRKLREKYGITPDEYDSLLAEQGGKCAICGTDDPGRGSTFMPVDHDHGSGKRRGLLCHDCNLGLSHFSDDPDRLMAAAAYLLSRQDVLAALGGF